MCACEKASSNARARRAHQALFGLASEKARQQRLRAFRSVRARAAASTRRNAKLALRAKCVKETVYVCVRAFNTETAARRWRERTFSSPFRIFWYMTLMFCEKKGGCTQKEEETVNAKSASAHAHTRQSTHQASQHFKEQRAQRPPVDTHAVALEAPRRSLARDSRARRHGAAPVL